MRIRLWPVTLLALVGSLVGVPAVTAAAAAPPAVSTSTGTLPDGADYLIEVPANWNHTLVLYSHGYATPGKPIAATDVGDPVTRQWLLANGFALAGSNYGAITGTGWAVQNALVDQPALVRLFEAAHADTTRVIAWGHSLGGMITAGLVQRNPGMFAGALPMCGVVGGGVGTWNQALDAAFAFQQLLDPALQVVHITNPGANLQSAEIALATAQFQTSPAGRARIALVAALGDLPGWFAPLSPEPSAGDVTAQEANQFLWEQKVDFPFLFAFRAELEFRAGGNPSWNTGVDYRVQFAHSIDQAEVEALYTQAGLSLDADLAALNQAARISPDSAAVSYLTQNIVYNGDLDIPVLTMHTTGDGLVVNQEEQGYSDVVREAGDNPLLRQVFVHRAGHCAFTPAETITAFQTLLHRLDTGRWEDTTSPSLMNAEAADLGPQFNVFLNFAGSPIAPAAPAFVVYHPSLFLRPFDLRSMGEAD